VAEDRKDGDAKRPKRISPSLKSMQRDPWDDVPRAVPAGTQVAGSGSGRAVRCLRRAGAGIEGLLHASELVRQTIRNVREVCKVGDTVTITVLAWITIVAASRLVSANARCGVGRRQGSRARRRRPERIRHSRDLLRSQEGLGIIPSSCARAYALAGLL